MSLHYWICFLLTCSLIATSSVAEEVKSLNVHIFGNSAREIRVFSSPLFTIKGQVESHKKSATRRIIKTNSNSVIQIGMPEGELRITLLEAEQIKIDKLQNTKLFISLQSAHIEIKDSGPFSEISLNNGQIDLDQMRGELRVHSYLAPIKLTGFEGQAEIRTYSGAVEVTEMQGSLDIKSFESPINLVQSKGDIQFHAEKSDIDIRRFDGSMKGYSNKGYVRGSMKPKKVDIQTDSGLIQLYFQNANAYIEAQSWKGKVYAPGYFYRDRAGGVYKAFGRIKDRGERGGKVTLKSQSGKISIL